MKLLGQLPASAERILKEAAQVGEPGSLTRTLAIEKAHDRVSLLHPEFFKSEEKRRDMKINVNNVRAAFLHVFVPNAIEDGEPAYSGKFIIPKDHPQIAQIEAAMLAVAKEKWGEKAKAIYDGLVKTGKPKNIEVPFVREEYGKDGEPYDGFENSFYLSARNPTRPLVIDRDKTPLVQADGKPYSGSYVNVQVEFWAQQNKWGKAIRATLKGVQFVRDGDAFSGGAPASADDFDEIADGADAGDLA